MMNCFRRRILLVKKYVRNDRVDDYRDIIELALFGGYNVLSVFEYYERWKRGLCESDKFFVLRHDVDSISPGTNAMAEVEHDFGVSATYYFRKTTEEPELIEGLRDRGFEVSVHFENIADFVKRNKIKNKHQLYLSDFKALCLNELEEDLKVFRDKYHVICYTVASHGERENRMVQTPNNYLTENCCVYDALGIKLEAYNKDFIDSFDLYISDSPIEFNKGYRYGISPFEAIRNNEKKILFLTHPNHWKFNLKSRVKKTVKSLIYGDLVEINTFKRI